MEANTSNFDLNATNNIGHVDWEAIDPTPDITLLFDLYNKKFFDNKLEGVEVEWSKRLKTSAGICYLYEDETGKTLVIRLSEPLLKFHSRKNLVETLLVSYLSFSLIKVMFILQANHFFFLPT